ncbi:IDEAL domain-containing protein [Oceanobacillus salinisoli]|uniref:IDEAL domain-containing protein n=1 Tax=Oceanobacillus salinisoli TaxID=2678611 RepID=UPI0012E0F624|nr:IDEAL domain-containing protein [Oceanobacillus salinisoli]
MKKQKAVYRFCRYEGAVLYAKKGIPYEFSFNAQLVLDEICFNWNKQQLIEQINHSIETNNKEEFMKYSNLYRHYVWE